MHLEQFAGRDDGADIECKLTRRKMPHRQLRVLGGLAGHGVHDPQGVVEPRAQHRDRFRCELQRKQVPGVRKRGLEIVAQQLNALSRGERKCLLDGADLVPMATPRLDEVGEALERRGGVRLGTRLPSTAHHVLPSSRGRGATRLALEYATDVTFCNHSNAIRIH